MYGIYNLTTKQFECFNESAAINGDVIVRFRGTFFCDTRGEEEILKGLSHSQDILQSLRDLNGQFAIVIVNKRENRLVLARDQFGIVPFYYIIWKDNVFFGTTIKTVLEASGLKASLNEDIIHEYFLFKYVSGEQTFFNAVVEVCPGTVLEIDEAGTALEKRYYTFNYSEDIVNVDPDSNCKFEKAFWHSMLQQTADRNEHTLGVLSSGGIDSSILVSCTNKIMKRSFNTYYLGYEGYRHNRVHEVNSLGIMFDTNHKNIFICSEEFADNLIDTIRINEEPLNHPSSVSRKSLYQKLGGEIDVLLSGEGADCLFCGYYIFYIILYLYISNPIKGLSSFLMQFLPISLFPKPYHKKITKLINGLLLTPNDYAIQNADYVINSKETVEQLIDAPFPQSYLANYFSALLTYDKHTILNSILSIYQTYYLIEGLNTIEKLGNAYGIQHRHPFIDVNLVNLFNKFPWKEKLQCFKRKYQVVELGKQYLPKEFFQKPKEGFGVPLPSWFYDENGLGRFITILEDRRTRERGIFKTDYLDKLLNKYKTRTLPEDSFECMLWPIINFELWNRIFIDNDLTGYS
jgi:asparagine synthase (glutamine-hydrolysing)